MKVAIIGAGVSGLSVAYFLRQAEQDVTIFEKSARIGGNVNTLLLQIGDETRWADLGVNDFNATTYTDIVQMLDKLEVPYKSLENTTSFSTLDGSVAYTMDGQGGTEMPQALRQEYHRFEKTAAHDVLCNPKYKDYTVAQYLAEKNYSNEFALYNLYPRVNGMYFVHDTTPADMPIRGIMSYYTLQEGFGKTEKPRRMYFAQGASSWPKALAKASGARIHTSCEVTISALPDKVVVRTPEGDETFDAVVVACHASTALKLFRAGITQDMVRILSAFKYYNSIAVAHCYAPLLPPNKNAWRTYNILIHDQAAWLRPYTISYVGNRHQNDAKNPDYNRFGGAYFFVTLDPAVSIPDQYVLRTPNQEKALAYFMHNVVSVEALKVQESLPAIQGQNQVFFTGGWTKGAGLQQECWLSAKHVAERILDPKSVDEHAFNSHPDAEHYTPRYFRDVLADA